MLGFLAAMLGGGCSLFSDLDSTRGTPSSADASAGAAGFSGAAGDAAVEGAAGGKADADLDATADVPDSNAPCATLGRQCVTAAPPGWIGPVAVHAGATAASCGGDYPTSLLAKDLVHADLQQPASSCACSCDADPGATCGLATLKSHNASNCANPIGSWNGAFGSCSTIPNICVSAYMKATVALQAGPCTPKTAHSLPPAQWGTEARACGGATPAGSCDAGESCMPQTPPGAQLCIYTPGDTTCPAAEFTERQVFFDGATDGRACSACTCGSPVGSCSGGTMTLHAGGTCSGGSTTLPIGACLQANVCNFKYATASTPSVSCAASKSTLSGALTAANPITFCCKP